MKLNTLHTYRGFIICRGVISEGDVFVNRNTEGGEYSQCLYALIGEGTANDTPLPPKTLTDLSKYKGSPVTCRSTAPVSAWVAFNPTRPGHRLVVRIINTPTSESLHSTTLETFIVPIEGKVLVNEQELETFKAGRLLLDKTASLTVPEGSVCALVNLVRDNSS